MTFTDRSSAGSGIAYKAPCRVASTANLTLSGTQTIDAVAVVDGDRVLAKDQTTGADKGIYIVRTGAWERAPDWDGAGDVVTGTQVLITAGTTNARRVYYVSTTGTIVIGTTSITLTLGHTLSA